MAHYQLYGRRGSGSFAVQVVLEEVRVPYQRVWVGDGAADIAALRAINPTGKVPALALPDGTLMFESAAMLLHLACEHPQADLAPPPGTGVHARFLQWMVFLSANMYESALRVYYPARYSSRGEHDAEAIREQGTRDFLGHLTLISQALNPYVLGQRYSVADPYLYMLASWFPGGRADLAARLPSLGEHAKIVSQRPAVGTVEADHAV